MQTLLKFKQFTDEILQNDSHDKESIIQKYKDDEDIIYYLNFIYNPQIITGISKEKLLSEKYDFDLYWMLTIDIKNLKRDYNISTVKDLLEYIKNNKTNEDEKLTIIRFFKFSGWDCIIYGLSNELSSEFIDLNNFLCEKVITKDLQLNIDTEIIKNYAKFNV